MVKEGYKDTEIGVIPIEWDVVNLDDVCKIKGRIGYRGYTVDDIVKEGKGAITLSPSNINNDNLSIKKSTYISWFKYEESPEIKIFNNDILFVKTGSTYGKTAIVKNLLEKATINPQIVVLKEVSMNNLLLSYLMASPIIQRQVEQTVAGGAIPTLSQKNMLLYTFPLPPLKEQEKIADILSTADDKIDAIATQIEKAETLKKGLLQKLLSEGIGHSEFKDSELGKIPESWEVCKVGKHTKLMGGYAFKSKDAKEFGTRWLKIANVGINQIKWEQTSYLEDTYQEEYKKFLLKENDIVLAMTRPILSMKLKIAKITNSDIPALLNQRVGKFIFDEKVNDKFMYQLFQHIDFVKLLMLKIMGTDPPNVSSEQLESIQISLPPLAEQKQIADILSTADEKLEVLRAKKEKYETLKKGLLQKLLSGEVRVGCVS